MIFHFELSSVKSSTCYMGVFFPKIDYTCMYVCTVCMHLDIMHVVFGTIQIKMN